MITARLTPDNQWIVCNSDVAIEMQQLRLSFCVKIPNWYIIKKKYSAAQVDETFMNSYGMIPAGLWLYLVEICKKYGYSLTFEDDFNNRISNANLSKEDFVQYANDLFKESDMAPYGYQIEGIWNALLYKNCCTEIATSGGKTLMAYIMFKYMIEKLGYKHILYVTPKTVLTTQTAAKFKEYDTRNKLESNWTYGEIHSKAKKLKEYDQTIVFGNYQSLCRKKKEFFDKYDVVIMDEAHHGASPSCKKILSKCTNAKHKIGVTGTFPKEGSYENMILQSYIGPVVFRETSFDLINKEKVATPVHVYAFELKYLDKDKLEALYHLRINKNRDDPTAGGKILDMEQMLARDSKLRFNYICKMIMGTTKNSLVIFSDIKNEYGVKIYNYIKDNSDKQVFYIDGGVDPKIRDEMKEEMEKDETGNTIIVASMNCFSEGIDISNMANIFLIESTKSDTIIAQLLGRGMRNHHSKDKTIMIDFVDDFRCGQGYYTDNYLYRHGKERQTIYKKRGFPCKTFTVELGTTSVPLI